MRRSRNRLSGSVVCGFNECPNDRTRLAMLRRSPAHKGASAKHHKMEAASFALEAQGKVIPVDGFLAVAGVGEELLEEIAHVRRGQMIVVVFAFPAETDQTDHA